MTQQDILNLKNKGYVILKNKVPQEWINKLSVGINNAFIEHRKTQIQNNNDITTGGVALHALLSDNIFINFLEFLIKENFIKDLEDHYFKSNCILNSLSALNNIPHQPNFSSLIHRDLRFYSYNLSTMVNCLLMVDDFTIKNGGTHLLPYSHLKKEKPTDEEFFSKSIQATGKSGDILVFNSNVWHSTGLNTTNKDRRGIPITLSRSFMKQLLDYPRAIGYDKMENFDLKLQQLLGYHSRVPSSLDEWYQPEDKRFYKKNQD
tara:strand:+ start:1401 stop:2186 length:786 start_codon:yes stop_codon:yes gene_type:complete